jgi:formylglycine-generating enzyme required for sulfatase activity
LKHSYSEIQDTTPPVIPDHEMIRLIGKGSYGQVWLARGVTGALRAVKVVRRSDFEFDRTFEREFEGIKNYEPISRAYPGLVAILHVGRNLTAGFYYYVMELADDRLTGREIIPELYVPHTLSSDAKKHGRLEIDECLRVGIILSDSLHHMHSRGLSHRDVKPSNVIFVDGHPELADIGLVAASGQRTFVGTEGFVPPEGPGSPQADIYSLGMVLYEISTGKDRMDFPEVPGDFATDSERKKWRQLNEVICCACAPSPKQRFGSAREMRQALERVRHLRFRSAPLWVKAFRVLLLSGLLAMGITFGRNADFFHALNETKLLIDDDVSARKMQLAIQANAGAQPVKGIGPGATGVDPPSVKPKPPVGPTTGVVQVVSDPPGARVFANGEDWGLTSTKPRKGVKPGEINFRLEREGYRPLTFSATVHAGNEVQILGGQTLEFYNPPKVGREWENSFGMAMEARSDQHLATRAVAPEEFRRFLEATEDSYPVNVAVISSRDPAIDTSRPAAMVSPEAAEAFCAWLTEKERDTGYLTDVLYYEVDKSVPYVPEEGSLDSLNARGAIFLAVRRELLGSVKVETIPEGASLYIGEDYKGTTPLPATEVKPGTHNIMVKLEGYARKQIQVEVKPGEEETFNLVLDPSNEVVFGKPWENSLGMKLVPMDGIMMAVWETRVIDYAAYLSANAKAHAVPAFAQNETHPVVSVSWKDARAFCQWLTEHERGQDRIGPSDRYRLPTDAEWSRAAGQADEAGDTPAARAAAMWEDRRYPWGTDWPPPKDAGNFADASAAVELGPENVIAGYDDGMPFTAPVGSFSANPLGIHDLAGNVTEFVEDLFGGESSIAEWAVTRGGDYGTGSEENLRTATRRPVVSDRRLPLYGFRVVLARGEE